MAEKVAIRPLADGDSLEDLTELIHRAYASLGSRGLNYTGVGQSVEETSRRISQGMCAVATLDESVVGTILARGGPNRFIEYGQWPGKRYRSVVLSKSLTNAP